ncbi:protein amalgam-like [Copidosoma floridanum]|uniref:protein amalgam-like n=1 Tax=Copidosoma floridanum TaxID=29053 RepID=UPI0006C9C85E|nr:protein amalgam-like [Copidosoma floridanum]
MSSAAVLRLLLSVLLGLASSAAGRLAAVIKTYENDTILLPCHVEDLGVEPRVRWWKKVEENGTVTNRLLADSGEPLAVMASPRMRMWGNRSLELHVRPEDSGKYVCQAQRPEPWGHVTQVHEIQVIYPPSVKTVPENGLLEVTMGEEAELACETEGTPKPVVTWKFEGKELAVGKRLLVHAANRSLAGLYTCRASNGIGNPARASIELRIKHKPEVSAGRRWVHSAPGIRAQLECLVVSWPEGRFEWFFKGKPLGRSAHVLRQKQDEPGTGKTGVGPPAQLHSLILGSLEPEDFGVYTCKASNELGEAETNVELSGSPRQPKLRKGPTGYNFIWEVDSYSPIFEYQFWFRQVYSYPRIDS